MSGIVQIFAEIDLTGRILPGVSQNVINNVIIMLEKRSLTLLWHLKTTVDQLKMSRVRKLLQLSYSPGIGEYISTNYTYCLFTLIKPRVNINRYQHARVLHNIATIFPENWRKRSGCFIVMIVGICNAIVLDLWRERFI